ncbi:MAG: HD domain-containing protein [bacterium]|nr:HD domain-containing protein [bacterium]
MKEITLQDVKKNPHVLAFISETEKSLKELKYTNHGLSHANLVADRARTIAKEVGLKQRDQELAAIAGFCHDMGNFIGRTQHHYWGSLLFLQVFQNIMIPEEIAMVSQAIANHDKAEHEMHFVNKISAVVVLADKSDVRRSRVEPQLIKTINTDIYQRVNYGATFSKLGLEKKKKRVVLELTIDTDFVPVIEYFEIFIDRMSYCRQAAEYLGWKFGLVINKFKLL